MFLEIRMCLANRLSKLHSAAELNREGCITRTDTVDSESTNRDKVAPLFSIHWNDFPWVALPVTLSAYLSSSHLFILLL